jgi:CubicO group peptidase (beta-lactamase class C family)
MMLVEDGRISLEDPVGEYLPELNRSWAGEVSIHHMLCQTSGIPNYTLLDGYLDTISKKRYTRDEFYDLLLADPLLDSLHFEPGTDFDYSNTNYFLIGLIVEKVAGKPFETVLGERILEPLGMKDTGAFDDLRLVRHRAYGYEKAPDDTYEPTMYSSVSPKGVPSGGLYSTARDMVKWHRALQSRALIGERLMDIYLTPHHKFSEKDGYAYGNYYLEHDVGGGKSIGVYEHGGSNFGTSTMFYRIPEADQCVILFLNGGIGREMFLSSIAYAIIDILGGNGFTLPKCDLLGAVGYTAISKDPEAVRAHYSFLRRNRSDAYEFGPGELSLLGHIMIQLFDDRETAALVFGMNAEEYPEETLVWTDLGCLYLENGEPGKALGYLEKALALSPDDDDIKELIQKARAETEGS